MEWDQISGNQGGQCWFFSVLCLSLRVGEVEAHLERAKFPLMWLNNDKQPVRFFWGKLPSGPYIMMEKTHKLPVHISGVDISLLAMASFTKLCVWRAFNVDGLVLLPSM